METSEGIEDNTTGEESTPQHTKERPKNALQRQKPTVAQAKSNMEQNGSQ